MSSTSAARLSARPSRLAPALEKARLRVVPRLRPGRTSARRMPFVGLVSVLLIGGVVGLLIFNTSMQQSAFSEQRLQQQADTLAAKQEALTMRLQQLDDPQHIAAQAQAQHMVIPATPAMLVVPSGTVLGKAAPADGLDNPQLWERTAAPRYAPSGTSTTNSTDSTDSTSANTSTKTQAKTQDKTQAKTQANTSSASSTTTSAKHRAATGHGGPKVDSTPKRILKSDAKQGD